MLRRLNQRGDTIVEVLIVIIVLAVVLGSGYAIATSSLHSTQITQERSYALKLAEGQLELLKAAADADQNAPVLSMAGRFCLGDDGAPYGGGSSGDPLISLEQDDFKDGYEDGCKRSPPGTTDGCATYCYYVAVHRNSSAPLLGDSYTVTVRWDGPAGNREQTQLSYKVNR